MLSKKIILDTCKFISITGLSKLGCFALPGIYETTITWHLEEKETAQTHLTINTFDIEPYIELQYTFKNEPIKYKVHLAKKKANIGGGILWFFLCPQTTKCCRKLYFIGKYFVHRTAATNTVYAMQTSPPKLRPLLKQINNALQLENAQEYFNTKYRKSHYKGKQTKKFRTVMMNFT